MPLANREELVDIVGRVSPETFGHALGSGRFESMPSDQFVSLLNRASLAASRVVRAPDQSGKSPAEREWLLRRYLCALVASRDKFGRRALAQHEDSHPCT